MTQLHAQVKFKQQQEFKKQEEASILNRNVNNEISMATSAKPNFTLIFMSYSNRSFERTSI